MSEVKKKEFCGYFCLVFAILLIVINIIFGLLDEKSSYISSYSYKMGDVFLDFDRFLGDFWMSVILSLAIAGLFLFYSSRRDFIDQGDINHIKVLLSDYKSKFYTCLIIVITLFVFGIIGVEMDVGLDRPYLDNASSRLILDNMYKLHFSEQILVLCFLIFGLSGFLILIIKHKELKSNKADTQSNVGFYYFTVSLLIILGFSIAFPLDSNLIFTSNSINELIYGVVHMIFIISLLQIIHNKRSNDIKQEKKEKKLKSDSELQESPSKKSNKIFLTIQMSIFIGLLGIIIDLWVEKNPYMQIGTLQIAQTLLSFVFRVFLTLTLYYRGVYSQISSQSKELLKKEDIKNE